MTNRGQRMLLVLGAVEFGGAAVKDMSWLQDLEPRDVLEVQDILASISKQQTLLTDFIVVSLFSHDMPSHTPLGGGGGFIAKRRLFVEMLDKRSLLKITRQARSGSGPFHPERDGWIVSADNEEIRQALEVCRERLRPSPPTRSRSHDVTSTRSRAPISAAQGEVPAPALQGKADTKIEQTEGGAPRPVMPSEAPLRATPASNELGLPTQLTASWLWKHMPLAWWAWLLSSGCALFVAGIWTGQTSFVRELLGRGGGSQVRETHQSSGDAGLDARMDSLAVRHVARVRALDAMLAREVDAASHALEFGERLNHRNLAADVEKAISEENASFERQLLALKALAPGDDAGR